MARAKKNDPEGTVEQLLAVLDRLPFVSSLKRDVQSVREILYQRRSPRIAVISPDANLAAFLCQALLHTRTLTPLLSSSGLSSSAGTQSNLWWRMDSEGCRLDWLALDLDAEGANESILSAVSESAPDLLVVAVGPTALDDDLRDYIDRAQELWGSLPDDGKVEVPVVGVYVAEPPEQSSAQGAERLIDEPESRRAMALSRFEQSLKKSGFSPAETLAISGGWSEDEAEEEALAQFSDALVAALPESAQFEAARAFQHSRAKRRELANKIVRSCSTIALTVGLAPVPLSDAFVIAPLQVVMVSAVAHLSGRPWDSKAITEWAASMGVVGGAGFGLRWTAQQLAKLVPGAGYIVSASVAGAGTVSLGQGAIAYFLKDGAPKQLAAE